MDYFGIESAAALGVSFGGYLVTRAAAHCPRITHVIAFDMMYRLLDGLTMPLPRPLRPIAEAVVENPRPARLIDTALGMASRLSADLAWKLQQGRYLTGLHSPSQVLQAFGDYTMEPFEGRITQPCLVLAGAPISTFPLSAWATYAERCGTRSRWRCARSITCRIRTWRSTARLGTLTAAFTIMGRVVGGALPHWQRLIEAMSLIRWYAPRTRACPRGCEASSDRHEGKAAR